MSLKRCKLMSNSKDSKPSRFAIIGMILFIIFVSLLLLGVCALVDPYFVVNGLYGYFV